MDERKEGGAFLAWAWEVCTPWGLRIEDSRAWAWVWAWARALALAGFKGLDGRTVSIARWMKDSMHDSSTHDSLDERTDEEQMGWIDDSTRWTLDIGYLRG